MKSLNTIILTMIIAFVLIAVPKISFAYNTMDAQYNLPNSLVQHIATQLDTISNIKYLGIDETPTYLNKIPSTKHSESAKELHYKSTSETKVQMKATAYTSKCGGCSGITKTGYNLLTHPDAKVVAVDPEVIPLGSTLYIPGYGTAKAVDTGSAIDGNHIDVYFDSKKDAREWGVKKLTVTVLS